MFSKFSEEAQKVLMNSKKEMQDLKHPYVGSEHICNHIFWQAQLRIQLLHLRCVKKFQTAYFSPLQV